MIAVKREVAALAAGFPWSECQVRKLTTSHCTERMSDKIRNDVLKRMPGGSRCEFLTEHRGVLLR